MKLLRRCVLFAALLAPLVALLVVPSAVSAVSANGTFTLTTAHPQVGQPLSFHYQTDSASVPTKDDNWIGIYDTAANGPVNQTYSGHGSTTYQYVHGASGDVTFTAAQLSGLTAGTKAAFFLYDDGYTWLARPIAFTLLPAPAPTVGGTLALTTASPAMGSPLTFTYNAGGKVDAKNWVAIYDDPTSGPIDQSYHNPSTVYQYVASNTGTVSFDTTKLTPGSKVAYFLYQDGYTWLADPVSFYVTGNSTGPSANGTLTLTSTGRTVGDDLTFHYATTTPNSLNWVGLYADPADGPTDQTAHAASTTWKYVSGTSGDVTINSAPLGAGTHAAYFLYDDGYTWLAKPIMFTLSDPVPPQRPAFLVGTFWAGDLAPGATGTQPLSGVLSHDPKASVTYAKTSGPSWAAVSPAGVVTAHAPADLADQVVQVGVRATDSFGYSATTVVEWQVSADDRRLTTASWNLWDAGRHVSAGEDKEIQAILGDRLDVVGLQQTDGVAATDIAARLGWHAYQAGDDLGIVSRYPLTPGHAPTATLPAASATVTVGTRRLTVWTADLDTAAYGPYAVCLAGSSAKAAVAAEKSTTRYAQAQALRAALAPDIAAAAKTPVVLLGDLSSASSLDWTAATSGAHCHAGRAAWPVTGLLADSGLRDSYRVANPDPARDPGITWSPVITTHAGTTTAEPQDRVDYVDFAGRLTVAESHVLYTGFPKSTTGSITTAPIAAGTAVTPDPVVGSNGWPSDHAAAVTTFTLK